MSATFKKINPNIFNHVYLSRTTLIQLKHFNVILTVRFDLDMLKYKVRKKNKF